MRVELASFRAYERKNVVLSSSERVSVGTIALEVGGLGETVTVEATGTHVNTTETQHGGVITRTQIEQIQVLGRDVTSLMRLLPGVRYTAPVDSMGGTFGVDVPNVGGLPADWSKVIIDGVVGNEVGNSGMQAQMVNLDAIAEVRLLNNSYRAEYGQSGGSQLQIVTRGGTLGLSRQRLLLRPQRAIQQHGVLPGPVAAAQRHRALPAQVPVQHLRRQPRRPGAQGQEEAVLLLLAGGAASCSGRRACRPGGCRRRSSGRETSRRPSTRRAG